MGINDMSISISRRIPGLVMLLLVSLPVMAQENVANAFREIPNRADSLRGLLTPYRSSFDVNYYHLDITVNPEDQSIYGSVDIHFKLTADTDIIQIDLYPTFEVEKITYEDRPLHYERENGALFVSIPRSMKPGNFYNLNVSYGGKPTKATPSGFGGFMWTENKGKPWITVNCQVPGASLWWPCKDHPSDEPDSMLISVTVPEGLMDVSNGRLRSRRKTGKDAEQFNWFVSYPINLYNVTLNIGPYVHFGERYIADDTLTMDYYVMPQNLEKAREHFTQVKPMMECFYIMFGTYPFVRDGYKLVETPYWGMEHQSAVSYGNNWLNGKHGAGLSEVDILFDYIIVHETAHEWWGNSVSANDIADWWIHESFGTYAEALYAECMFGYEKALRYVNAQKPKVLNDRSIVAERGIYKRGSGDMYVKGMLMLNTIRHVVNDDRLWKKTIYDLAFEFRITTTSTDEIIKFFNDRTGMDLTPYFEVYLYDAQIPVLETVLIRIGDNTRVRYRWKSPDNFNMPVKVTTGINKFEFIHPSSDWQELDLGNFDPQKFKIALDQFFIDHNLTYQYLDPGLMNPTPDDH